MQPVSLTSIHCPECNMFHPKIDGPCPMAKAKEENDKYGNIDHFMKNLKEMIITNIEIKKIKNFNKLYAYLSIEIFNKIKEYKED